MTHDEFLAKIDNELGLIIPDRPHWSYGKALRAVVELHFNDNGQCGICRHEWDFPCETIQAIEKELA